MKNKALSLTALLLISAVFTLLTGCTEEEVVVQVSRPESTAPLIDNSVLRQAELELTWAHAMPISGSEKLRDLSIIDNRVYAVSNYNYLMSLDLNNAEPVYGWKLSSDSSKMCGLAKYENTLYSIITTDLSIMEWREGTKLMSKRLSFGPLCPPDRNSDFYYVAGSDQRIHAMRASDLVEVFQGSANDGSNISGLNASNKSLIFGTEGGNLISMWPGEATQMWRFTAQGSINSSIVRNKGQVIFSSGDAYVYVLDEDNGNLVWKYLTPTLLTKSPIVTEKYVYQTVDGGGLLAINRSSGKLDWQVPNGAALLSEKGSKAYVMTNDSNLVVMDVDKKKEVSRIVLPMISRWVSNVDDDKIILADDYGRIVCIKPIEY